MCVAYKLSSLHVPPSSCFHDVCRLQVSGISSIRRFQTSFCNVLSLIFLFSSRVSLLGFLSLCSAYVFQAGFIVFSAPNLVFVACIAFSLVFGIFCSYLFSISILPFGAFFSWCVASFVLVYGASFWSSISHFLYFAVRVSSACAPCHIL